MKTINALISTVVMAFVMTTVSAQTLYDSVPLKFERPAQVSQQAKQPQSTPSRPDIENDTWRSIGTGQYRDDFFASVRKNVKNYIWDVEVEQSNEHPGVYRLLNPYKDYAKLCGMGRYDDSEPHHLYIHTEKVNDHVYLDHFHSGFYPDDASNVGEMYVMSVYIYGLELEMTEEELDNYNVFGKLNNGLITFSSQSSFIYLTGISMETGWYGNNNNQFAIALPGGHIPDYSISINMPECSTDRTIEFEVEAGADMATIKYGIYHGKTGTDRSTVYSMIARNDNIIERGKHTVTSDQFTPGCYTVIAAGLRTDGTLAYCTATYTYMLEDDDDNWVSLGNVKYGDDLLTRYKEIEPSEFEVELQMHKETVGLLRIVNPYKNWPYANYNQHDCGHNHYMYIHAEDPDRVWIDDSPLGVSLMYGTCNVSSLVKSGAEGVTDISYGHIENRRIVFPRGALLVGERDYSSYSEFQVNANEKFYIELPEDYYIQAKDYVDFQKMTLPMSSSSSNAGDITTTQTYTSGMGRYSVTVTPSDTDVPNCLWNVGGRPQLRMSGGQLTIPAIEGYEAMRVEISGAFLNGTSSGNNIPYTINGMYPSNILGNNLGTVENNKVTLEGIKGDIVIKPRAPKDSKGYIAINTIMVMFRGTATDDILTVTMDASHPTIYNLNGQQIPTPPTHPGLYIIDGKKVMLK